MLLNLVLCRELVTLRVVRCRQALPLWDVAVVLSDPGHGGWILKLVRDGENPGHLEFGEPEGIHAVNKCSD